MILTLSFWLNEVGVDLWAEGGTQGDDERHETLYRLVVHEK